MSGTVLVDLVDLVDFFPIFPFTFKTQLLDKA